MRFNWKMALGTAAIGGALWGFWRWETKRQKQAALDRRRAIAKKRRDAEETKDAADVGCLEPYLQPGARLAPQVRESLGYARSFLDPDVEIGLTQRTQTQVFSAATRLANSGETEDIHRAVQRLLREIMPDCPWHRVAFPVEDGSDWAVAYEGVEELLQLAALEMRYEAFRITRSPGDQRERGIGLICPGWNHAAPAPTINMAPGDLIEVMLGAEDTDGDMLETVTAYMTVDRVDGNKVTASFVRQPLPEGIPPLSGSEWHGFAPGDSLVFDRRCIYTLKRNLES